MTRFKGIPFENKKGANLCYCNSVSNALLSSEQITSRILQYHCDICNFLLNIKNANPYPIVKSAKALKEFVARFKPDFQSNKQQDCCDFLQTLLEKCSILKQLTLSIVHVTFKCTKCEKVSRSDDERNILYEDFTGSSIANVISGTDRTFPNFFDDCFECKMKTVHEHNEKMLMLPEVMIVNLKRFKRSRSNRVIGKNSMEIEPSIILHLEETFYSLNAVVSHFGTRTDNGHYIATLQRDGWIDCNDTVVLPANGSPKMGYLFFYDKVSDAPSGIPNTNVLDEQSIKKSQQTLERKHQPTKVKTDFEPIKQKPEKRKQPNNSDEDYENIS